MIVGRRRVLLWSLIGVSVSVTSLFCLGVDWLTEGLNVPLIYWLFAAGGFAPAGFMLWKLAPRLPVWGLFGLMAGTIVLLPWIPYSGSKMLVRDMASVRIGMPESEARARLSSYDMEPIPRVESDGGLTYTFRLDPLIHRNFGAVTFKNGVVEDKFLEIE